MRKTIVVCLATVLMVVGAFVGVAHASGCGTHPKVGGQCDGPPDLCEWQGIVYGCSAGDAQVADTLLPG